VKVKLQLFAVARQWADTGFLELELSNPATIGDVRRELLARWPKLSQFGRHLRFAVNTEYADDATPISPEMEIACIPPPSGG
jgi:molybdopterin converting factor small subunit